MKTWQALKAADEGKKIRRKCWGYGVYSFKDESRFCNPALITHYGWKNFKYYLFKNIRFCFYGTFGLRVVLYIWCSWLL